MASPGHTQAESINTDNRDESEHPFEEVSARKICDNPEFVLSHNTIIESVPLPEIIFPELNFHKYELLLFPEKYFSEILPLMQIPLRPLIFTIGILSTIIFRTEESIHPEELVSVTFTESFPALFHLIAIESVPFPDKAYPP